MKKVWILEKFESAEASAKLMDDFKSILEKFKNAEVPDEEDIAFAERVVANHQKRMDENPNGYWGGFIGKTNYKAFCWEAKDAMRRNPEMKFRVVSAQIEDSSKTWVGYTNPVENQGVYRYLRATMR